MPGVQVDLILDAVQPEADRPFGSAAIEIINEQGLYLLSHGRLDPLTGRQHISVCSLAGLRHSPELCTTAVTIAEIRYGLERLPDGRRKDSLLATATEVFTAFSEFIQPFDADAVVWYATIVARRDRLGPPMDGFDAQIAAICRTRGAALATHNTKDLRETGVDVIDPWQER